MIPAAQIFTGRVIHKRLRPKRHELSYGVFSLLLDLDELDAIAKRSRFFSHNRFNLVSFHDCDHGPGDGTPSGDHARELLKAAGVETTGLRILLLAYPRVLGYVFNPLSVYYAVAAGGALKGVIYEVTNTWGERRSYVMAAGECHGRVYAQSARKELHVSPFAAPTGTYGFRVTVPDADLLVGVYLLDAGGALLKTHFKASAQPWSDQGLLSVLFRYPLLTIKIIGAIHFEALKLWWKGVPLARGDSRPGYSVSYGSGARTATQMDERMDDRISTDLTAAFPPASGFASVRDAMLLGTARKIFGGIGRAAIKVTGPSGRSALLGGGPTVADIRLKSIQPLWNSVTRGGLGFAESYLDGDIETSDLRALMLFFSRNYDQLSSLGHGLFKVRSADKVWHQARSNTRAGSRENIRAHYDLGNDFYKLWLDPGITYSSGVYASGRETLAEAQELKYQRILNSLQIRTGMTLLEIGCGWGGMAERAALAGAAVTAITVSAAQKTYARQHIASCGLADRAAISFTDYRDTAGEYDRVVSLEMIEAVGEDHWPEYFATLSRRLKAGGCAVIQAITIREQDFAIYQSRPDFIQRYIFPGGMLPTVDILQAMSKQAGLRFEAVDSFGASYALTLRDWRAQFNAAWPQIIKLGFDERFRRMWNYYLTYCEVGFECEFTDVGIYRLTKIA